MLTKDNVSLCDLCFKKLDTQGCLCPECAGKSNITAHPMALKEGSVLLGKYAVGKLLGKGGFGITYLCYDLNADKPVAIKEFFPETLAYRTAGQSALLTQTVEKTEQFKIGASKFYEEAKLVSRFNGNPNIIGVYEFFYENNTAYFVMEYLDGFDFKHYIQKNGRKISEGEAVYVIDKVLEALVIVHSLGVLHRDISPDNIYMCGDGNIKLIDFGAARQVVGNESKSLSVILKAGFAPIEQYQKKGNQGPWTDIYALGATLYYAVTGLVVDNVMSRLEDPSLDLSGVSPALAQIITKMLAVKAEERYQSAVELKSDIARLQIPMTQPRIEIISEKPSFCIYCGKTLTGGIEICDDCKNARSNANLIPKPNAEPKKPQKIHKNKKKWLIPAIIAAVLAVAAVLVIALGIFGKDDSEKASAGSQRLIDYGDCGENLKWTLSDDGVLTVSGNGDMYDYNTDENGVSTAPWGYRAGSINEIVLEEGVEYVGEFAFVSCGISEITMPSSMQYIGDCAFANCLFLERVSLNDSLWCIGEGAFCFDTEIKTIEIPESVSFIEFQAFYGWTEGQRIILDVTESYAYESWEDGWNDGCYAKISYLSSGEHIHSFDEVFYEDEHPHYEYQKCTTCGYEEYTGYITSFYDCEECDTDIVDWGSCGEDLIWELYVDGTLYITGSGEMYDYEITEDSILTTPWAGYTDHITSVEIDEDVEYIGNFAFALCDGIEEVVIPSNVWGIGSFAFAACNSLSTIDLANVEVIGYSAFFGSTNLKEIVIPQTVYYIGSEAFKDFTQDQSIYISATSDFVANWEPDWNESCEANVIYIE